MSWQQFITLAVLGTTALLASQDAVVTAAPGAGFNGDCQTFAYALAPCGVTFAKTDIEVNGLTYIPPQTAAKCACTETMQKVLWKCTTGEQLAGIQVKSQPPTAYQTQCMAWGITVPDYKAPYTGQVAPGADTFGGNTIGGGGGTGGTGGTGGGGVVNPPPSTNNPSGGGSTTPSGAITQPSNGSNPDEGSSGPNGAAIGISLGIIGLAALSGALAFYRMRSSRRRREPLDLDATYVGLDDQWEKPRSQSPPVIPAPAASGAPVASRGPMQAGHRPPPFESRPGGGGSVVGGYDGQYDQYNNQYDQYDQYNQGPAPGYDAYNHGGYQAYPPHDYGFEHTVPTSGPYHGGNGNGKGGEGGQYM
ncbi:hypothetical protein BGX34_010417 [Mortierella sp. NVP85]|nr:hypothetical protein BGX34_010417 [Mortierella sp. NVP85]